MNTGLLEILSTREWMLRPSFVHGARAVIQQNLNSHAVFEDNDVCCGERVSVSAIADISESHISTRTGRRIPSWDSDDTDPYINLMYVTGPITRNGGACSYGSAEHRDMIMEAADDDRCVGHVFFIDTPGGSAWAKNDYRQAIDYAHSKNQPVLAFIDGDCCSAGMYLASMCDGRYFMHPNDEVGCIGTMAAFYTVADGSKNQYDDSTYHELYDPESFDKNKDMRDVANEGDAKLIVDRLAQLGAEFRTDIMAAFPKAKDEHIHGKVFKASEVEGIFLDGQATLGEVLGITIDRSAKNGVQAGVKAQNIINNKHTQIMDNKFTKVAAACGVDELVVTNEGTHLDVSLVQNLEDTLGNYQAIKTERDSLKAQLDTLTSASEKQDESMENLNAAVAERDNQIEELNARITELQEQNGKLKAQNATHEQTIADRDATIAELTRKPGPEPDGGASPSNNGTGAEMPHMVVGVPQMKPGQSRAAFLAEVEKYHERRASMIKSKTQF